MGALAGLPIGLPPRLASASGFVFGVDRGNHPIDRLIGLHNIAMSDVSQKGLSPRAMEIFNTLVGAYVEGGQPVGSKTLSQMTALDLSPASIRSNMSDLEEAGLLFAPHTSAGRIPTETGLRLFVDGLMEFNPDIPEKERLSIDDECGSWHQHQ